MLQFEEVKQALVDLEPELRELADALGLEKTKEEIEKLEQRPRLRGFGMIWKTPRRCFSVPVR